MSAPSPRHRRGNTACRTRSLLLSARLRARRSSGSATSLQPGCFPSGCRQRSCCSAIEGPLPVSIAPAASAASAGGILIALVKLERGPLPGEVIGERFRIPHHGEEIEEATESKSAGFARPFSEGIRGRFEIYAHGHKIQKATESQLEAPRSRRVKANDLITAASSGKFAATGWLSVFARVIFPLGRDTGEWWKSR
jgi:hypothetical protein